MKRHGWDQQSSTDIQTYRLLYEIWGSHGSEDVNVFILKNNNMAAAQFIFSFLFDRYN
jgi:hypothetical protein